MCISGEVFLLCYVYMLDLPAEIYVLFYITHTILRQSLQTCEVQAILVVCGFTGTIRQHKIITWFSAPPSFVSKFLITIEMAFFIHYLPKKYNYKLPPSSLFEVYILS